MVTCSKPVVVVHGGAGRWDVDEDTRKKALEFLKKASQLGLDTVIRGGNAVDAVVEAIKVLEDSGIFNAGVGSVLNVFGEVEMDAGIMDGKSFRAGGVAAVTRPRHPIELARIVMERTDHVIIVGKGADRLADLFGLEPRPPTPSRVVDRYRYLMKNMENVRYWRKLRDILKLMIPVVGDTVGAVALDNDGNVAAGASTGGVWLKLQSRVGDSPIPGAGFYADNRGGGASATGLGETIIMTGLTRVAVEFMVRGLDAENACLEALKILTTMFGNDTAGIIAVDIKGNIAAVHNTEYMPYAYACRDRVEVFFRGTVFRI
ncbi:MAG: isoaspartyl peptidase/L-asparaginase [Desulfurococcaceae archaeon]|jgi:beta-aspartyl-peptidase (threonine type)|nr:isoaspartyl peptidase/L-asparaginase [Desulfurococcaceae archaeon]